jgi:hypothetical protein
MVAMKIAQGCRSGLFTPVLAAVVLAASLGIALAAQAPPRVVAVGDVHANLEGFTHILQQAKLIDASRHWIGGKATLIQCGDSIDRGPDMRGVLDFLMALEKQASKKGGRVITLLGNHEAMNIYGDLRYVTPGNFASFADSHSEKRREKAWKEYVEWRTSRAAARKQPEPQISAEVRQQWLAAHPLGFFEHREAFGEQGKYGKWLRERPALVLLDGTVFVHGGIAPEFAAWKLDDINKRVRNEIQAFDSFRQLFLQQGVVLPFFTLEEMAGATTSELNFLRGEVDRKRQEGLAAGKTYEPSGEEKRSIEALETFLSFPSWLSIHSAGPLWFRGYGSWTEEEGAAQLEKLAATGARRFVAGHTPQLKGSITVRFDGRVFLIDTGMLSSYYAGGKASALEISGQTLTAIYPEGRAALAGKSAVPATAGTKEEESLLPESEVAEPGGGAEQSPVPATQGSSSAKAESRPGEPVAIRTVPMPLRVWLGPHGSALPFQKDAEVREFLRTAAVKSMKEAGGGINNPYKVLLEKDGVQMHAIFRDVDEEKDNAKFATGRREAFFRDSYLFELAAYDLAQMLGLDNVPPVVRRRINGKNGSLQLWIEQAFTETKRQKEKIRPPDVSQWNRQVQMMHAFDSLIYNDDRNMGNVLIDKNWKLWMIDHTRAFRRYNELKEPEKLVLVNLEFLEALKALNREEVKAVLKESLRAHEIEGVLRRRDKLVQVLEGVIAQRGEKAQFTWETRTP